MKYPNKLINKNIGITAMSDGQAAKIEKFNKSLKNLKDRGFNLKITPDVYWSGSGFGKGKIKAQELNELINDKSIEMIICASGGDFLYEIIPYVDYESIKKDPKWYMGNSDPTTLLYIITTMLDIATIYGFNASSFDEIFKHQEEALKIMNGNIEKQLSYEKYEAENWSNIYTETVYWKTPRGEVNVEGRIIGGCIDSLKLLINSEFDYTKEFINRYYKDGIIWYFDNFSLTTEDFYLTLLSMKRSGWFKNTKAVILGRVCFPGGFSDITYEEAIKEVFPQEKIIINADIGHVSPRMTIINGSYAKLKSKDGKGSLELLLK